MRVSRSGYYAWETRPESERAIRDRELLVMIKAIHTRSHETYGSPRVHAELRAKEIFVGRKRVERLMAVNGLCGFEPKKRRPKGMPSKLEPPAGNLLDRNFVVEEPNQVWTTDITQVWTWQGWLYVAVVLDLFSRRVVGWSTGADREAGLVVRAMKMALGRRQPPQGLLMHSDRGSQFTSAEYLSLLAANGIQCSFSRRGDCYDNAVTESFFATLKKEKMHRHTWPTLKSAADTVSSYIETFYNPFRRHSHLGLLSPCDYERIMVESESQAA